MDSSPPRLGEHPRSRTSIEKFEISMKPKYSLRAFLVGSIVIGLIFIFALKMFFRVEPEKINTVLIGETINDPTVSALPPTLFEIVNAVSSDYKNKGIQRPAMIHNPKIELVSTSIGPEKFFPLLGNSRIRTSTFRCSVTVLHADRSTSDKIFLIQKQNFELLTSQAGTEEIEPQ